MSTLAVVVTHATSPSGLAIARHFFHGGAHVAIVDADASAVEDAARSLRADPGGRPGRVRGYSAGPPSHARTRQLAAALARDLYRVDLLVNSLGGPCPAYRETEDGVEFTYAVNYHAPFLLTHLLLDSGRLATGSRIINVVPPHHRRSRLDRREPDVTGQSWRSGFAPGQVYATATLLHRLATTELARRLPAGVTVHLATTTAEVARASMTGQDARSRDPNRLRALGRRLLGRPVRPDDTLAETVYTRTTAALGIAAR